MTFLKAISTEKWEILLPNKRHKSLALIEYEDKWNKNWEWINIKEDATHRDIPYICEYVSGHSAMDLLSLCLLYNHTHQTAVSGILSI